MSTRFTENIDQLDEFYRQSFEDGGMEPPADMWDRVETSLDQADKQKKGFFTKRNILISLVALLLLALILWWLTLMTDTAIPKSDFPKPDNKKTLSVTPEKNKETPKKEGFKNRIKENKNSRLLPSTDNPNNLVDGKADSSSYLQSNNTPVKADSSEAKPEPKKRLRFRDKYKKTPSDTIPLFIPE